ncbi:hypothetical protein [Vibrio mediterranei]|uniref:hypothetical protein n=1 Tax=Vibrio mediterranei TaxID=689 RepID=UPI0022847EFE|nr:hypothetical protein [Vibrio mediterranei]MCY9853993.1 hypothetical protein [Vibrio mediterranei]
MNNKKYELDPFANGDIGGLDMSAAGKSSASVNANQHNLVAHPDGIQTMCSSQFAELFGYEKKKVNQKIREMFPDEIDGNKIVPSFDARGYVDEYHLPEVESNMFVCKMGHLSSTNCIGIFCLW